MSPTELLTILIGVISVPTIAMGFLYLLDFISDSDIWIRKEDRDQ